MPIMYTHSSCSSTVAARLAEILVPGALHDSQLERMASILTQRYRRYIDYYPFGLWAPGLRITREMHAITDLYLPMAEIRPALLRLVRLAYRIRSNEPVSNHIIVPEGTWLDLIAHTGMATTDPGAMLRSLMADGAARQKFLFSVAIPRHHGNSFGRYPGGTAFLREWARGRIATGQARLRCLDAACGSGEGTWDAASVLVQGGYAPSQFQVDGISLHPLEIFSAAHGFFPHDPVYQHRYRRELAPLVATGVAARLHFTVGDLRARTVLPGGTYDAILCNGLLGGPMLRVEGEIAAVVANLVEALLPGGLLLVADSFHGGWKRRIPGGRLAEIMRGLGMTVCAAGEGLAGIKR